MPVRGTPGGTPSSPRRLTGVVLGFSGLLLLIGILALDSAHQIRDVNLETTLRKQYTDRSLLLDQLHYHNALDEHDSHAAEDEFRHSIRAFSTEFRRYLRSR